MIKALIEILWSLKDTVKKKNVINSLDYIIQVYPLQKNASRCILICYVTGCDAVNFPVLIIYVGLSALRLDMTDDL